MPNESPVDEDLVDWVNIYAQWNRREPAYIVGTKADLKLLRDLIDKALANGRARDNFYASDGEMYEVRAGVVKGGNADDYPCPYFDGEAFEYYFPEDGKLLNRVTKPCEE